VSDNLRARIEPLARNGPVIHIQNPELYPDASALAAKLAIEWPRTFLRHSYISNRLPIVKSADAVALEAGNSPAIIFKHYWELATGDQPREWFGIHPWPKFRSLRKPITQPCGLTAFFSGFSPLHFQRLWIAWADEGQDAQVAPPPLPRALQPCAPVPPKNHPRI